VEEATQAGAERQQALIVGIGQGSRHHSIVARDDGVPTW
jgi:hypothetical protein